MASKFDNRNGAMSVMTEDRRSCLEGLYEETGVADLSYSPYEAAPCV